MRDPASFPLGVPSGAPSPSSLPAVRGGVEASPVSSAFAGSRNDPSSREEPRE